MVVNIMAMSTTQLPNRMSSSGEEEDPTSELLLVVNPDEEEEEDDEGAPAKDANRDQLLLLSALFSVSLFDMVSNERICVHDWVPPLAGKCNRIWGSGDKVPRSTYKFQAYMVNC